MGNFGSHHRKGTHKDVDPLSQVYQLLNKFIGETKLNESPLDTLTGLMILSSFHFAQLPRLQPLNAQERQIVRDAARYMKFASAAYGWRFVYPFLHKGEDKKTLIGSFCLNGPFFKFCLKNIHYSCIHLLLLS
jgi:hypothetical protein